MTKNPRSRRERAKRMVRVKHIQDEHVTPFVYVLQHIAPETLGTIEDALTEKGIRSRYVRTFENDPVPDQMDEAAGLIVMGGPMGVYESDRYPHLKAEIRLMELALSQEKPILGVCLGSQLLAHVLGANISKGKQKEIGWYPVHLTSEGETDPLFQKAPKSFVGFHWHGDVLQIPSDAILLASSDMTRQQAFRYRDFAYGLQFHLEPTGDMIRAMTKTFSKELERENISAGSILDPMPTHIAQLHEIGSVIFSAWADLLTIHA